MRTRRGDEEGQPGRGLQMIRPSGMGTGTAASDFYLPALSIQCTFSC